MSANRVEDGWKGLLTFKSTRDDVDKVLGVGVKTKPWSVYPFEYRTDDAVIGVRFSREPCEETEEAFFRHNLPVETLREYGVTLNRAVPLAEFTFDKNSFERDVHRTKDGELLPSFTYRQWLKELGDVPNEWSAGTGIEFWGEIINGKDYVTGFHYGRPYGMAGKVPCDSAPDKGVTEP